MATNNYIKSMTKKIYVFSEEIKKLINEIKPLESSKIGFRYDDINIIGFTLSDWIDTLAEYILTIKLEENKCQKKTKQK